MEKNKKIVLMSIIILLLMLLSFGFVILVNKSSEINNKGNDNPNNIIDNGNESEKDNDPSNNLAKGRMLDHNRYLMIEEIIQDFIINVNSGNNTKAYYMLEDNYINQKGIEIENIRNYFSDFQKYNAFKITNIKQDETNNNIQKYLVTGRIKETNMHDTGAEKSVNYTVFLDQNNLTFAIALENNYQSVLDSIFKNDYNSYTIKNINDQRLAEIYYYDLLEKILLKSNILKSIITNYEAIDFNYFEQGIVKNYSVLENDNQYTITINDSNNKNYTFYVKSVLDYTVKIS